MRCLLRENHRRRCVASSPLRGAQVTASVFLDLIIVRAGIEMDIQLVKLAVQPMGIISIKDGASTAL